MTHLHTPIYMDHHATTPVDAHVLEAMIPFFTEKFGNAASHAHVFGWEADEAVERARGQVADAIGASPNEIVFTSGATESNNLIIKGIVANCAGSPHIIVSAIEHRAILDPVARLEQSGINVTRVGVGSSGIVDPDDIARAMTPQTVLISIMMANNEIGTIQPIREIGSMARDQGVAFHTDAAQAVGHIPVDVEEDNIDSLSLSAHKLYGPKGIGALYVRHRRPRIRLVSQIDGGGHERGLRSGTLPVPLIVGLGAAIEIAKKAIPDESTRVAALRDRLFQGLLQELPSVTVNGSLDCRLPHNLNLSFEGVDSESVLNEIRDVSLSSGSACSSAEPEASHVLSALGLTEGRIQSAIRFGLGRSNTVEDVDYTVARLAKTITRLREQSPRYRMGRNSPPAKSATELEQ